MSGMGAGKHTFPHCNTQWFMSIALSYISFCMWGNATDFFPFQHSVPVRWFTETVTIGHKWRLRRSQTRVASTVGDAVVSGWQRRRVTRRSGASGRDVLTGSSVWRTNVRWVHLFVKHADSIANEKYLEQNGCRGNGFFHFWPYRGKSTDPRWIPFQKGQ